MKVKLYPAPWCSNKTTKESEEAIELIQDNVWRDASIQFYAERDSKIKLGKTAPKGMQKYLNAVLMERFKSSNWIGGAGYVYKGNTWIRITFRHQMSLGSDILDAIKVCKLERMELAIILAAGRETLKVISPNDAMALVSFEKLHQEVISLNGALDIPLMIGELIPVTHASRDIDYELQKDRPRDRSIPVQ